ncbi:hypothetical protein ACLB2K_019966 [Fragaria x ananassa]
MTRAFPLSQFPLTDLLDLNLTSAGESRRWPPWPGEFSRAPCLPSHPSSSPKKTIMNPKPTTQTHTNTYLPRSNPSDHPNPQTHIRHSSSSCGKMISTIACMIEADPVRFGTVDEHRGSWILYPSGIIKACNGGRANVTVSFCLFVVFELTSAYKIITKIMIKRLKPLLEKCISKNQGAFAPGRAIQDNILIAHEIFSDFHRRTGRNSAMAVKLDLEKAFDLLDWPYIQACLCWFQPTRGIRQGDPLSPYIFILAMEPLIRNLNLLASNSKSQVGLLTSPLGFRISNLMFADDCLIFAKASKKAARNISQVLDAFSAASGQKINFHKSSLFFSDKVNSSTKNEIVNVINIQHKRTIGKYLGLHNVVFWKDPTNAKELLQRISNKLSGWKQNTLSRAGKTTLIKANISGMPNHVMSCFKCPKKLTDEIDKQSRNFLWGTEMKTAPIAWKEVCMPKVLGGLGIRPSVFFNKAAIAKLAWKVITDKENWWVQVITRKYLKHGSLFQAKKKPKNSMAWNGILDAKDLIFKGLRWVVGNEIMGIPIPVNHSEDEFIWGPSPHGKFTVKSATWMQLQDTQEHCRIKLIKKLWSLNIQPKIKFFGWLLLRGRLKTRDRLSRFGITEDNSCCLCNEDNETVDHLFGYCRFTRKIWETMNMCPPID